MMTSDLAQLFMCLLAISRYSLEKCLFKYFGHCRAGWLLFLMLSGRGCIFFNYIMF